MVYDVKNKARFIRGNHDNPIVCRKHKQWIKDGHFENGMMFIGGALSIDRSQRTEGFDWWRDEECSHDQFYQFMDKIEKEKPEIIVTHDCPLRVIPFIKGSHHGYDNSRTQQALQAIFELHQPKLWVHGHHHVSFRMTIEGTKFICLSELEILEI